MLEASDTLGKACAVAGVVVDFTVAGATLLDGMSRGRNQRERRYDAVEDFDVDITNSVAKSTVVYASGVLTEAFVTGLLEGLLGAAVVAGTAPAVLAALAAVAAGGAAVLIYNEWLKPIVTEGEKKNFEKSWLGPAYHLFDGYISGATVFADANGNGKLDPTACQLGPGMALTTPPPTRVFPFISQIETWPVLGKVWPLVF